MKNKKGNLSILLGLLLIAAAFALTLYNRYEEQRAQEAAQESAAYLTEVLTEKQQEAIQPAPQTAQEVEIPDYILNPEMDMPVLSYEGYDYIGMLEIPSLSLELPIISQWSDAASKIAPCRYSGSAYTDDLVLAAHNYRGHFWELPNVKEGDSVFFTDVEGNQFRYVVSIRETLQPTAVEDMVSSDWDLTLFTCTFDGANRVTIRCTKQNDVY